MVRTSIIIVYYNQIDLLFDCLTSLIPTLSSSDEVIIVDNASQEQRNNEISNLFPFVKLIKNERNIGFGGGNNLGVEHAKGKYFAFLNPDTVVENGWLDHLIQTLETHPRVGMITPKILLKQDTSKINTCGNSIHISGLTLCRGMGKPRDYYPNTGIVNAVSGACFLLKNELYKQIGGFNETFFMYMEETDLSLRSRLVGYQCFYDADSTIYHNYNLSIDPYKVYYQERNRYLLLLNNFHFATLIILVPVLLISEIVTWGFVLLKDLPNWKNKIRAYIWICSNLCEIMKNHKKVQLIRKITDRHLILEHAFKLDFEQTSTGLLSKIAHIIFDTIFFVLSQVTYLFVWW